MFTYIVIKTSNLDAGENYGRSDFARQQIHIDSSIHEEKQLETLIHEMIHIAYRHTANILKEEEEKVLKPWSMNIYGILKENNFLEL